MTPSNLPNLITGFRIVLIIPLVAALLTHAYGWALAIFVLAGLSDGIDGYVARHFGWSTPLGALMDPAADKLLMTASYISLAAIGFLPGWLAFAVVLRDLVIAGGALAYRGLFGVLEMEPAAISKLNTLLQLTLVFTALLALGLHQVPVWWVESLSYVVFASTLLSGINYVWVWSRRAMRAFQEQE